MAQLKDKPATRNERAETDVEGAMREMSITEAMLDNRPGQRGIVDHGDRIVFNCLTRNPDGTISGHFQKSWART